jgi:hypothetical protein
MPTLLDDMVIATNGTSERLGWVDSPDGRGTIDIIWGCLLTILLCVWTVLTINVPAKDTTLWEFTLTKLKWMAITLFGPEWLFGVAGGQWSYARRSVKQFKDAGIEWTMRQSFFADMGGIRVSLKDDEFPVNSRHLLVFVNLGLVKLSTITPDAINDRSKADGIAKLFTILQTGWFILQCVARLAQQISITSLELSTIAFVVCTIGTNIMWFSKPKDVIIPIILEVDCTLKELLEMVGPLVVDANAEIINWKASPLEKFDDLRPNFFDDAWRLVSGKKGLSQQEQKIRFRNDRLPPLERDWLLNWIGFALSLTFGAVYVAGWNISFPTHTETVIWRVCIITTMSLVIAYWILDLLVEFHESGKKKTEKKPVPPIKIAVSAVIALIYVFIRMYILMEPYLALRSLPPTAFQTINWSEFFPHL